MDYSILDDQTLLRLVVHRDEKALEALYDRFSRLVFSLAMNIIDDEAGADEITQDVFLNIWNKSSTYDASLAKVVTWIVSITRNRAIDLLRSRKTRPESFDFALGEQEAIEIVDPMDIEAEAEINQSRVHVRQGLAKLPEDQRKVLSLAYFGGYSHSEIAQILDEPLGTIKTRLRLAMQKLRQYLTDEDQPI